MGLQLVTQPSLPFHHHRAEVVSGLFIVGAVGAVAVGPVFSLPASTERRLLRNVLDVDHVDDFGVVREYLGIYAAGRLGTAVGAERPVRDVSEARDGGGRGDEGQPVPEA
jgi:hypothetical protein